MKKFWLKSLIRLITSFCITTVIAYLFMTVSGLPARKLLILSSVTVLLSLGLFHSFRIFVEYWAMEREARYFKVDLDFFAQVMYTEKWSPLSIQMDRETFGQLLESKKLSLKK